MKKIVLIFLAFSIPSFILSQEIIINPPLGLKFGLSEGAVRAVLNKYGTFYENGNSSYGRYLSFRDVSIGTTTAIIFIAKFVNNKLFEVFVAYSVDDTEIQGKYDSICEIISNKYGSGREYRTFKYPYEDKEDDFIIAVKAGYAEIETYWGKPDGNMITVVIEKSPTVTLRYQSYELTLEVEKIVNSKNTDQF